jgi:hypothetical protein
MKIIKPVVIIFLIFLCFLKMPSLSVGDRYYRRLSQWYLFAQKGDWVNAAKLESKLDYTDISAYKTTHDPSELKKYVNNLMVKPNKSVEDWLELSRIQSLLGKTDAAGKSLSQAKALDPIRDDISQMYYQLFR